MKRNSGGLLRKFCLESSFLGLKYFYLYPDRVSRCFWMISVVSIFLTACLLSWLLYKRFEEMPTRITIENQYESTRNIPYPSIGICTPNQITTSALKHLNSTLVDGNRTIDFDEVLPQVLGFFEIIGNLDRSKLAQLENLIQLNRYNALQVMGMLPQKCEEFLKVCFFKNKVYPNCKSLFYPIFTDKGFCCIFNSIYFFKGNKRNEKNTNFTVYKRVINAQHFLTVVTDYDPNNAVDGTIINAGAVRVMVMQPWEFPSVDESRLIQSNTESFHIISPTYTYCSNEVASLPMYSRKCYFADEIPVRFFSHYYNSDCDLLCYVKEIERRCHCIMIYIPYVRVERSCNFSSIGCINDVKQDMSKWYKNANCDCPRDCVSFRYRVDISMGNFDALPHIIHKPYKKLQVNENSAIMHFVLARSVYVKRKQETVMSLISFSSNLGGVFGLCLGFSVISVFEIFFFIYLAIRNMMRNRVSNVNR